MSLIDKAVIFGSAFAAMAIPLVGVMLAPAANSARAANTATLNAVNAANASLPSSSAALSNANIVLPEIGQALGGLAGHAGNALSGISGAFGQLFSAAATYTVQHPGVVCLSLLLFSMTLTAGTALSWMLLNPVGTGTKSPEAPDRPSGGGTNYTPGDWRSNQKSDLRF